jgi:hypothetical protein
MCWSFDVSIISFLIASVSSFYLYTRNMRNDRLYAVYIFVIGLMQGSDALAWYSIDNAIPKLNKIVGILSWLLIVFQIPMIYGYLYKTTRQSFYLNVIIAFIGYIVYVGYRIWNEYESIKITVKPNCKNDCHLEWNWLPTGITDIKHWITIIAYSVIMLYPLLLFNDRRKILMILIPVLTLMYSLYKFKETRVWGSYWCSTINLWSLIAIVM